MKLIRKDQSFVASLFSYSSLFFFVSFVSFVSFVVDSLYSLNLCNLRNLWFLVLLFLTLGRGRQPALCSFRVPCLSGVRHRVMTTPGREPVGLPSSTTNTPPTST